MAKWPTLEDLDRLRPELDKFRRDILSQAAEPFMTSVHLPRTTEEYRDKYETTHTEKKGMNKEQAEQLLEKYHQLSWVQRLLSFDRLELHVDSPPVVTLANSKLHTVDGTFDLFWLFSELAGSVNEKLNQQLERLKAEILELGGTVE